jgi:hypothetical protein
MARGDGALKFLSPQPVSKHGLGFSFAAITAATRESAAGPSAAVGVTHVTAAPGRTDFRKKSPALRGARRASFTQGELNASRPVTGTADRDGRFAQGSHTVAQCCGLFSSSGQLDDVGCYPSGAT